MLKKIICCFLVLYFSFISMENIFAYHEKNQTNINYEKKIAKKDCCKSNKMNTKNNEQSDCDCEGNKDCVCIF